MTTFSTLAAMTLTAGEQSAAQAAVGYEDAQGMLSSINNDIANVKARLSQISSVIGAGTNKTAIDAAVTALA